MFSFESDTVEGGVGVGGHIPQHIPQTRLLMLIALLFLAYLETGLDPLQAHAGDLPPHGLYVYSYPKFIQNGQLDRALRAKGLDGAAVVMKWAEIEPARGRYDFSEFDRRVELIRSHGLAIELAILAGGGAPEWIYLPTSEDKGARRLDFVFSHHNGKGPCIDVTLAPPWDASYQAAFAEMLEHVAAHLRETGALNHVSAVKLTGVSTDTDETRLPAETPQGTGNPCVSDAISIWQSVGYRPSNVVQAMRGIAGAWAHAFPDTWKVLAIIPQGSFPPIGEDGRARKGRQSKSLVRQTLGDVAEAAERANRGRFIIQMDWLIADRPVRPFAMELARRFAVPVAWQTNFYLNRVGKAAACGGKFGNAVPCDNTSFLRLLQSGMYPEGGSGPNERGAFIEVFPPDVIEFAGAVAQAHDEMMQ